MTETCHPLPPSVAEELLQVTARAICDRPGETAAQRDSRTRQMVHLALAMLPRDGLEYMLSILTVGHFNLILDSMREVFLAQPEAGNSRAKSTIVALDRSFLGLVKELRLSRKRPSANPAVQAPPEGAQPEDGCSKWTWNEAPAASENAKPPLTSTASMPASPTTPPQSPGPDNSPPVSNAGEFDQRSTASAQTEQTRPPAAPGLSHAAPTLQHPQSEASQHLAAFEEALVAVAETLETARALQKENATAGE